MKDIYVYPDTFVLINKLNIKTSKELDEAENALVSLNIANLLINPFKIKSVFDIKKYIKHYLQIYMNGLTKIGKSIFIRKSQF